MPSQSVTAANEMTMTVARVRARVNRFLFSQAGTHFAAGEPNFDAIKEQWSVPILMITPGLVVGEVGEAIVAHPTREVISHTPIDQLHAAAGNLREKHHVEIEAAFIHARKV